MGAERARTLGRRGALCLVLPLLLATLGSDPASAAPRGFFGIQDWRTPPSRELHKLSRAHISTLRADLAWNQIEPRPGARNWRSFDTLVRRAARARVTLLPVLLKSPSFAAPTSNSPPLSPSSRAAFVRFVADAVARYGRHGAYWSLHPDAPYVPITAWQVWNEPNFPAWWNGRPSAGQYVALLRAAAAAIHSRDRRARVVTAGLPETRNGIPMTRFLRSMYRIHDAKSTFDVVAVHPYAADQRGVLGGVIRARRIMRRAHDSRAQVWVTEVGWATAGPVSLRTRPFRTTPRGQARRLKATMLTLLHNRRRYRIRGVVWFTLRDRHRMRGERNWWAINTGLLTVRGRAKPAWRTYLRLARRH